MAQALPWIAAATPFIMKAMTPAQNIPGAPPQTPQMPVDTANKQQAPIMTTPQFSPKPMGQPKQTPTDLQQIIQKLLSGGM